jgi:hypothetical protein
MKLHLGLNANISNKAYHADRDFVSSSVLKTLYYDTAEYEKKYIRGESESSSSPAMDEGSAAHSLILEPHLFSSEFAVYAGDRKQGAVFDSFKAANSGKIILSEPQMVRLKTMVAAYNKRPEAIAKIAPCDKEATLCIELLGVKVKIRADALNVAESFISDIKTTGYDTDHETFSMNANSKMLSYDISAALYTMACEAYFGKPFDFYFVVLGKRDYTCEVFKASEKMLINGRNKCVQALTKLQKYRETGKFTDNLVKSSSNYEILDV